MYGYVCMGSYECMSMYVKYQYLTIAIKAWDCDIVIFHFPYVSFTRKSLIEKISQLLKFLSWGIILYHFLQLLLLLLQKKSN